jgi:hypothetical protein
MSICDGESWLRSSPSFGGAETTLAAFERFEDNGGLFATYIFSQPL